MRPDPERDALYAEPDSHSAHAQNRLWMLNAILAAFLFLTATNADAAERWAASQPPNWFTETVRLTAGTFAERMAVIGLDAPKLALKQQWEEWKAAEWEDGEG